MRVARAVALACLLAAPSAQAYVRTRAPSGTADLLWPDARITMTLRTAGAQIVAPADLRTAATRAAATWSDPGLGSSVRFSVDSSADAPAGTAADHVNTISFRTQGWDPPMYPAEGLALTTVWSQSAQIIDADTEINAADPRFKWGLLPDDAALAAMALDVDLQNALTHELGHVLGLDHPCYLGDTPSPLPHDNHGAAILSCDDPALPADVLDATMYPSSEPGSIAERSLSSDEIAALHDLYPAAAAPADPKVSLGDRGGCRYAPAEHGPPERGLALCAIALTLARRRRRRILS
jgi:hypothetical protein